MISLLLSILAGGVLIFAIAYVCFIVVMSLERLANSLPHDNLVQWLLLVIAAPFLVVGYPLDIGWNWTYGLVLGITPNLTLSGKLKHIRRTHTSGWRLAVAKFVCEKLLNPWDSEGCHC